MEVAVLETGQLRAQCCSNLVGSFKPGEDADTLSLTGYERYSVDLLKKVTDTRPGQDVTVTTDDGKFFTCVVRFDTQVELTYFNHGGILPYVIRNLAKWDFEVHLSIGSLIM